MVSKLIQVTTEPKNAEAPLAERGSECTPTESFYVRNHFPVPKLGSEFRLDVRGSLHQATSFDLAALQALPPKTLRVTLECAGNGRMAMTPKVPGTAWGFGAMSTATFTGTPLAEVLNGLGIAQGAIEVLFTGADQGKVRTGAEVAYERSLPLDVALHPDTLLCWAMNDEPLTPDHGAPLRLVVPRWYAMASVKWLTGIELLEQPFGGFFQADDYVYRQDAEAAEEEPVRTMQVRSTIITPEPASRHPTGPLDVEGIAWSGDGEITEVEVSVDGGSHWHAAELAPAAATAPTYATRAFRARVSVDSQSGPNRVEILSRAHDSSGRAQPLSPRWNSLGYGNNGVKGVSIEVR